MAITGVTARWNGQDYPLALDPATGEYFVNLPAGETPGRYPVTVRADNTDSQADQAEQSILIRAELIPPEITFTTPPGWYQNPAQPIAFTLRDAGGVDIDTLALTLDGKRVTGAAVEAVEGGYDCTYTPTPLSDGSHVLAVSVADESENTASASLTWQIDTTAPTLAISWPASDLDTNQADHIIAGLAGDAGAGLDGLTINGQPVALSNGAFALPVTLTQGENLYTFTVTDLLGNTRTEKRRVVLDVTPPVIVSAAFAPDLHAPPSGQMYRVTVTLAPSPEPRSGDTVTGSNLGVPITFTGEGLVFTGYCPRAERYEITLVAADAAGNVSQPYVLTVDNPLGVRLDWSAKDYLNAEDLNRIEQLTAFVHAGARSMGYSPGSWLAPRGQVPARTVNLGQGQTLTVPAHTGWVRYDPVFRRDMERIIYNVDALRWAIKLEGFLDQWRDIYLDDKLRWETLYAMEFDLALTDRYLSYLKFHKAQPKFYSGQVPAGVVRAG